MNSKIKQFNISVLLNSMVEGNGVQLLLLAAALQPFLVPFLCYFQEHLIHYRILKVYAMQW